MFGQTEQSEDAWPEANVVSLRSRHVSSLRHAWDSTAEFMVRYPGPALRG